MAGDELKSVKWDTIDRLGELLSKKTSETRTGSKGRLDPAWGDPGGQSPLTKTKYYDF